MALHIKKSLLPGEINGLELFALNSSAQVLFSPKEFKASKYPNISTQRRIFTLKTIKKNKYDIVKKS